MSTNSERSEFTHTVSAKYAALIPEDIFSDENKRREHVDTALNFGLKAMKQAALEIDTSFVEKAFKELGKDLDDRYIGTDSNLSRSINELFTDPKSAFSEAVDLNNKESNFGKFMAKLEEERKGQHEAIGSKIESIRDILKGGELIAEEASAGHGKGRDLENDISEYMNTRDTGDSFIVTADQGGVIAGSKKGDILAEIKGGNQRIVFEAKAGSFTTDNLTKELDEAMANRGAEASIGVLTVSKLKSNQQPFMDVGKNRFIVAVDWDVRPDWEAGKNAYTLLEISYRYLKYIISQGATQAQPISGINLEDLRQLVMDVGKKIKTCSSIKSSLSKAISNLESTKGSIGILQAEVEAEKNRILDLIADAEE